MFYHNRKYYEFDNENIASFFRDVLKTNFSGDYKIFVNNIRETNQGKNFVFDLTLAGIFEGKLYKFSTEVPVKKESYVCSVCLKKASEYYEAIIQLRILERKKQKDLIDELLPKIQSLTKKSAFPLSRVVKVIEKKNGVDVYIGNAKIAEQISKKLSKEFGAKIKKSSSLVGQTRTGRRVYRFTYLLRF